MRWYAYNGDADGVCNEVLDLVKWGVRASSTGHHVNVNWTEFRHVDEDGDVVMQNVTA